MSSMLKMVDGKLIACSTEEEARILAERQQAQQAAAQEAAAAGRCAEIDQEIATQTLGQTEPKTVAELKAMTRAEISAWFDGNVPMTAAGIHALAKRLFIIVVRRVL